MSSVGGPGVGTGMASQTVEFGTMISDHLQYSRLIQEFVQEMIEGI
jgi:hypothetical protein